MPDWVEKGYAEYAGRLPRECALHLLEIPAGKSVELKPGGYHIMFMQLKQQLKAGDTVKGVLTFEKAGAMPVEFKVEAMAGGNSGHKAH